MIKIIDKERNFRRNAERRANEVIGKVRTLGHCSNRSYYEYSEEQVNAIFNEIQKEVEIARGRFHFPRREAVFSLTGMSNSRPETGQ